MEKMSLLILSTLILTSQIFLFFVRLQQHAGQGFPGEEEAGQVRKL